MAVPLAVLPLDLPLLLPTARPVRAGPAAETSRPVPTAPAVPAVRPRVVLLVVLLVVLPECLLVTALADLLWVVVLQERPLGVLLASG